MLEGGGHINGVPYFGMTFAYQYCNLHLCLGFLLKSNLFGPVATLVHGLRWFTTKKLTIGIIFVTCERQHDLQRGHHDNGSIGLAWVT